MTLFSKDNSTSTDKDIDPKVDVEEGESVTDEVLYKELGHFSTPVGLLPSYILDTPLELAIDKPSSWTGVSGSRVSPLYPTSHTSDTYTSHIP